jgi:hypothetical protein
VERPDARRATGAGSLVPALLAGVGIGWLASEKLTIDGGSQSGTSDPETLSRMDMIMILGGTLDLGDGDARWFLDARFAKSLLGVADDIQFIGQETPNLRNRTLSLAIGRAWDVF